MKRTMRMRNLIAAAGIALALATVQAAAQPRNARNAPVPPGVCYLNQFLPGSDAPPAQALTEAEKAALNEAIQDEYMARATYEKVLEQFGAIRPFVNIIHAEDRHVEVLAYLFERYGLEVPEDNSAEKAPSYDTLKEAAEASVAAERENGALYDTLLAKVENPEVRNVFSALRYATMEHHLPALQRLVDVENGLLPAQSGMGRGRFGGGYGAGLGRGGGAGFGGGAGYGVAPGRGRGYGAAPGNGRGRGAGWNAGPGRGRGYGAAPGYGRGQGRGQGARGGWGRGVGRGFAPPPGCPWY